MQKASILLIIPSVADPDPGSSAFLTIWSEIRDGKNPEPGSGHRDELPRSYLCFGPRGYASGPVVNLYAVLRIRDILVGMRIHTYPDLDPDPAIFVGDRQDGNQILVF